MGYISAPYEAICTKFELHTQSRSNLCHLEFGDDRPNSLGYILVFPIFLMKFFRNIAFLGTFLNFRDEHLP